MPDSDDPGLRGRIASLADSVLRLEERLDERAAAAPRDSPEERRGAEDLAAYREEFRAQNAQLLDLLEDLAEAHARYVDLYDSAPFPYFTVDSSGTILEANLTGARLLRHGAPGMIGWPMLHFVAEDCHDSFLAHMRRCRGQSRSEESTSVELDLRSEDETRTPVELHTRPTFAFGDNGPRFRIVAVDLTERRRAEAERQELMVRKRAAEDASVAKDRFLAMLSHELRTPLTPAVLILERLEQRDDLPDDVAQKVGRIRRNIQLEARLIDDLLDVSRIEQGRLSLARGVVDVHDVLESAIQVCADEIEANQQRLDLELDASSHRIQGDPTRVQQIFWNLLRNAVKYTPRGGSIRIATRNVDHGLSVTVADTGRGITLDAIEHIFEPFQRAAVTPAGGTATGGAAGLGLGLAITRDLVGLHGGAITAHSDGVGQGAEFEVVLPVIEEIDSHEKATPSGMSTAAPQATVGLRILLVEDHPDTADALAELLREAGYDVVVSNDVRSATAQDQDSVDVLISDMALPDGTGVDVLRSLGGSRRLPAIAVSGFGTDEDLQKTREAGFDLHMTKPLRFDELLGAIERLRRTER